MGGMQVFVVDLQSCCWVSAVYGNLTSSAFEVYDTVDDAKPCITLYVYICTILTEFPCFWYIRSMNSHAGILSSTTL